MKFRQLLCNEEDLEEKKCKVRKNNHELVQYFKKVSNNHTT
jgi:hypothetical protein